MWLVSLKKSFVANSAASAAHKEGSLARVAIFKVVSGSTPVGTLVWDGTRAPFSRHRVPGLHSFYSEFGPTQVSIVRKVIFPEVVK